MDHGEYRGARARSVGLAQGAGCLAPPLLGLGTVALLAEERIRLVLWGVALLSTVLLVPDRNLVALGALVLDGNRHLL